jgi:hypothetical protein
MNGTLSVTCIIERSAKELRSQKTISVTANGFADMLSKSDVPAPKRLPRAMPTSKIETIFLSLAKKIIINVIDRMEKQITATGRKTIAHQGRFLTA